MRVTIYVRVSTTDQTTDNQRFELERYAAARGWTVVATFTDVISGSTTSRPELDRMLRSARRRNFDLVLIWKLDRLGRSLAHLVTLAEELQQIGVALVSLGENIDGSTTTGRLMLGVMASLAQFEKERLVERVRAGLSRAKRQGKVLGRPHRVGLTEAQRAQVAGLSSREAAAILGCSQSTAARMLQQAESENRDDSGVTFASIHAVSRTCRGSDRVSQNQSFVDSVGWLAIDRAISPFRPHHSLRRTRQVCHEIRRRMHVFTRSGK